jgi:hypothetical protein
MGPLVIPRTESSPSSHRAPIVPAERIILIRSSDGFTDYAVQVLPDGSLRCDKRCRGFLYRRDCRHVADARAILEAERAGAA